MFKTKGPFKRKKEELEKHHRKNQRNRSIKVRIQTTKVRKSFNSSTMMMK
jgi:hypothetical protein